jgi:hypothetical protein
MTHTVFVSSCAPCFSRRNMGCPAGHALWRNFFWKLKCAPKVHIFCSFTSKDRAPTVILQSPNVRWNACTRPNYAVQLPLPHARAASSRPTAASSSRSSNEMRVATRVIFSFFRRKSRAFRFLHSETEQCNLHARVQHQMLAHRLFFFRIRMLYHLKIIKNYTP